MVNSTPLTREDHDEAFTFMEMAEIGIPSVRINIVAIRTRFFFWNISTEINGVYYIEELGGTPVSHAMFACAQMFS